MAFDIAINQLEQQSDEVLTVGDLQYFMEQYLEGSDEPYDKTYIKRLLTQRFGNDIVIAERDGTADVVTLRPTAARIIHKFYLSGRDENNANEQYRILKTASELIRSSIEDSASDLSTTTYPSSVDIESLEKNIAFLPEALKTLLLLICPKARGIKIAALGQALMQMTKPRSLIAPLQIGLGVQMHNQFSSRFLIDTLSSLGFCSSYTEVQRYEKNAAVTPASAASPDSCQFVQYVADNVDHNVQTLDGSGTVHAMGMISVTTPAVDPVTVIPRGHPSAAEIRESGGIGVEYFSSNLNASSMVYHSKDIFHTEIPDETDGIDLLWLACKPYLENVPSFSAFMQSHMHGDYTGTSSVNFMPMIDMSPTDPSCI